VHLLLENKIQKWRQFMKSTAIKIVSGVLVVAIIVVAALAIAGVFNTKTLNEVAVAEGEAAVNEQHMFRNFDASTVLYIRALEGSTPINGDPEKYIHVVHNSDDEAENGALVAAKMEWADKLDGNNGAKPVGGWKAGMFYAVSLAAGYEFVNEEYKGLDSFMCIIDAPESTEADTKVKDGVIMLEAGKFSISDPDDHGYYTLTVQGTCPAGDDLVFVYDNGMQSAAYRKVVGVGAVENLGSSYKLTVEDAGVRDVYEYIYVNKSYDVQESDIQFMYAETEASLRSSEWFLAAVDYLYGEDMAEEAKTDSKWITVKFDPGFTAGTPSIVKLNITITFNGLWKDKDGNRDTNGKIIIKIANTLTPVFDVHIQDNDNGKAFDASLDLDIETTATIEATYAASWSSLDEKDNKLTDIANGLASLVEKVTSDKLGGGDSAKPYTFAKWIIPIGTLPICVEDTLGFELGASFAGEVGAVATNKFHATFGIVYAGGDLQSYHNVDDKFHFDNITLAGNAGAKVGLINEVGISAYGTISINLGVHAGVYADLAGRLSLSGDDIISLFKNEKSFNIVPAYYFETGVYLDMDANGKVFGFTIAKKNFLAKKFPLYKAGHKYLPESFVEKEGDDTIYMQNSYYYIIGWDVMAWDIQSIGTPTAERNLAWSEFDYTLGDNLRMDGNVIYATKAEEFESFITVTSKVNKGLSRTIKIVKNPEAPTTTKAEQVYDLANPDDCYWKVMVNSSKIIEVKLDGKTLYPNNDYEIDDESFSIKSAALAKLKKVGTYSVVIESSKGYLQLYVRVVNTKDIEVTNVDKTFDKAAASSIVWKMNLQGNDIVSVVENGAVVSDNYYSYREASEQFVMLPTYWNNKEAGDYSVAVTCSSGDVFTFNVKVVDNRAAKINTTVYEFVKGSKSNLQLDVTLYENSAKAVTIEGVRKDVDKAYVPASLLSDKAAGEYSGSITVSGSAEPLAFIVKVVASQESLIVPIKNKVFYKSSNDDVKFDASIPAGAKVEISNISADNYQVVSDGIVIKASFLKSKNLGDEWSGTVKAGGEAKLTISLINDIMPAFNKSSYETEDKDVHAEWNLQGAVVESVVGLAEGSYKVEDGELTVYASGLAYGSNDVTVYTSKNTLSLNIVRKGKVSIDPSCTVNKTKADVATYALNTAHLEFSYVEVDNATILASSYRYNGKVLTLANEFVYNLAEGTYNVHVYFADGSKVDTTLVIIGNIADATAVADGYANGSYLIYTADQLVSIANNVNVSGNNTTSYTLMADIDMMGKTLTPIGNVDHPYMGTFDGNGYTISNLTVNDSVKAAKDGGFAIGMFGVIGEKGTVENLRINGANVTFAKSGSVSAGIIAGRNAGIIDNVTISNSSISAESKSWLDIKNAYFDLGAAVGYNDGGQLSRISIEANINGKVKGLNVFGIQIGGRKSLINVGAAVGYFTSESVKKSVRNIQGSASITCDADNNSINQNGWYGNTDLTEDEINANIKRVNVVALIK
jgi:hypothetical protein